MVGREPLAMPYSAFRTPHSALGAAMALWQAIERYHELLVGDIAAESQGQLSDQQRRRGLYFGDRPLASVLRPRFMAPEQYHHLEGRVRVVLRAFQKAYDAALADAGIRQQ